MTTYTERTLGATTFTERSSDAVVYTERSLATPTITERGAMAAVTFTERSTVVPIYFTTSTTVTFDEDPPVITNIHANLLYDSSAEIDWDTDEPATCKAYWTTNSSALLVSWLSGDKHAHYITNNRHYTISGLSEKTTYYFRVQSEDVFGNLVRSEIYYFNTPGRTDGTPGTLPAQSE